MQRFHDTVNVAGSYSSLTPTRLRQCCFSGNRHLCSMYIHGVYMCVLMCTVLIIQFLVV